MSRTGIEPTAAPQPFPRVPEARVRRLVRRVLTPFWVVPAGWCVAAVIAGVLLPEADGGANDFLPFIFQGGADGARAVLSTIAGAMISVTGLVFSITIVVLQLASSQFTPRVLRTFLDDRITQHTLGVFAASFLFALTVLRSIDDSAPEGAVVPQLAVTAAFLLVLGAVAMFLAFIHHIANAISVGTIIQRVADQTRSLLERSGRRGELLPAERPVLTSGAHQTVARARRTGRLDAVDFGQLVRTACAHDARIELLYPLGSFVPAGAPLALIHLAEPTGTDWDEAVGRGVDLRRERSMEQDVTFGLRRLVDIAERALSPGINDPTTAVQVLDELHDILRSIASVADPYPVQHDADGVARLVTKEWTFEKYLDLAVDEIARWGRDGVQIPARIDEMLSDLAVAAAPEHRRAVEAKATALS